MKWRCMFCERVIGDRADRKAYVMPGGGDACVQCGYRYSSAIKKYLRYHGLARAMLGEDYADAAGAEAEVE